MKRQNRIYLGLLFILLLAAGQFFSCETEDWLIDVDCNDCFGSRPDSTELIIYVSINSENPRVPLEIFSGKAGGEPAWLDTAYSSPHYFWAAMEQEYTVMATYRKDDKRIRAYDSDVMKSRDYGETCGDPCYMIKGGIYDLNLMNP